MARAPKPTSGSDASVLSDIDQLLLRAMESGDESLETGRYVVTYNSGAADDSKALLEGMSLRMADFRDFAGQHEHGYAARRRLCSAVGADEPELARAGALEQAAGDGASASVPAGPCR